MKKNVTKICLGASLLIILDTIGFWHMLLMFLFAGIIPGTSIVISPNQMMILMILLAGIVIIKALGLSIAKINNLIVRSQLLYKSNKLRRLSRI